MVQWSLAYDADTGVVTLVQSKPFDHGGLIRTSVDPSVWTIVEAVNGELDATVVQLGNKVCITGE